MQAHIFRLRGSSCHDLPPPITSIAVAECHLVGVLRLVDHYPKGVPFDGEAHSVSVLCAVIDSEKQVQDV
jgi:hypothetical protein